MNALEVGWGVVVPLRALDISYSRSGGPGGQNVNKVETKAVVRLDVAGCRELPDWVRPRLLEMLANRLTKDGVLIVTSERHRERAQNLSAALARMTELLHAALTPRTVRRATKPTRGSQERRLASKRKRGGAKRSRQDDGDHDDD